MTERLTAAGSNIPADTFGPSPSQTVGPYFHPGLLRDEALGGQVLVPASAAPPGRHLTLTGRVLDADGLPVPDALLEIWQPGLAGVQVGEQTLTGFGRSDTRQAGGYWQFQTVRPAPLGGQAPHLSLWLGLRGLLTHLHTRLYFSDDDHAGDPVLALLPPERRATLIAAREDTPGGPLYRLDLRLQGEGETVFFDVG